MAITFQKKEEKQKYLISAFLLIIILVIFLTVYFGFLKKQKPFVSPTVIYQPPKVEIKFETLKNPFLKELLIFEEIKPFEGKIGRENPLLPY